MLNPQEAAAVLKDADAVQRRSVEAYGYRRSAPFFFIWGAAWAIGYGGAALFPAHFDRVMWLSTMGGAAATVGHILLKPGLRNPKAWRIFTVFVLIWAFTYALFAIFQPSPVKIAAYWPLLFSVLYIGAGLWLGLRYVLVGLFLAAATLGGYFLLREHFYLWMAAAGGGTLLLTGIWLRQP